MSIHNRSENSPRRAAWALVPAVALLLAVGCSNKSPNDKIADTRARYTAELNGFVVKQEPVAMEAEMAVVEVDDPAAAEEPMIDDGGEAPLEEIVEVDVVQDVILDIVVRHEAFNNLPGITVDISMQDGAQQEKGSWKLWVDTADLEKGTMRQVSHVLEGISYEEGDGFFVEVRSPILPEERSDYAEFGAEN